MNTFWLWLEGLGSAVISAFSTSACGVILLPSVFNFSHDGLINMAKVSGIPALWAGFAYLKQKPLPGINIQPPALGQEQEVSVKTSPALPQDAESRN